MYLEKWRFRFLDVGLGLQILQNDKSDEVICIKPHYKVNLL